MADTALWVGGAADWGDGVQCAFESGLPCPSWDVSGGMWCTMQKYGVWDMRILPWSC